MTNYYSYITSEEWRDKADEAKFRAGYRCQICNASEGDTVLHAHHRTYERLGNERPEDITVLCQDCHGKFHDKSKPKSYRASRRVFVPPDISKLFKRRSK